MRTKNFMFSRNYLIAGIILIFVLLQSACVTKYGPMMLKGGYEDMALGESKYQVSFTGNGYTANSVVKQYLLYRCAEVARQNDYEYFSILEKDNHSASSVHGSASSTGYSGVELVHPAFTYVIYCSNEPEANSKLQYKTDFVLANMAPEKFNKKYKKMMRGK